MANRPLSDSLPQILLESQQPSDLHFPPTLPEVLQLCSTANEQVHVTRLSLRIMQSTKLSLGAEGENV